MIHIERAGGDSFRTTAPLLTRGPRPHGADEADVAKNKLSMPLLVLSGEKAGGPFLIEQGKMVATKVEGVLVKGRGHWLMEEAPDQVIPKLVEFLNR